MSKKRTVTTRRRRRTTSDGGRDRADAPRRKKTTRPSSPRPRPSSSGGSGSSIRPPRPPSSSGGGLPSLPLGGGGKPSKLMIGILVLVGICFIGYMLISGGGGSSSNFSGDSAPISQPPVVESNDVAAPTADTSNFSTDSDPFIPPSAATEGQTWTIMLYQDADDKILEKDIYVDLNEAERIGSTDRVYIVSQVDRFSAGYQGDGNWASTKRFYITQDNDLQRVHSQQIADIGEANMSDGATLVDFVTWAVDAFPADKYVLIMSDHGMGWPGGWSDPTANGRDNSTPLSSVLGDQLYLNELDDALAEIRARTGIDQFEMIGMDACLMGHIEVFSALAPHARYAVASQETEPALGWAYAGFLGELTRNPDMTGADLSRAVVASYIDADERIVDDVERADLLRQGSPLGGLFGLLSGGGGGATMSAGQLAQQMGQNVTITAVDLAAIPALMRDFNNLAVLLQDENQRTIAQSRTYAQSFTSVFGSNVPPSYIDLGSFVQLIKQESGAGSVGQAVDQVMASLSRAVIAEKHGPKKAGATGISVYFPNSQLYRTPATGPESYTAVAHRFAQESLWDDYLAYHYTGRRIDPTASAVVVPDRSMPVEAPGAGQITVSPLALSDNVAAPGQPILLSADISGENLGYVYLFVGFVDQASNSVFLADADYLESDASREIGGIFYPDWGEGEFTVEFEWEPIVFAIDDGVNTVVARFTPQTYGAAPEDAVYTVDGIYTYADGGESRYARLYFQDGLLRQVFGFNGQDGTGAPREIIPNTGDTFTVLEQWLDLGPDGQVVESATQEGGMLTFGDEMFFWIDQDAAPGQYIVGFIVEDLDGNKTEVFQPVTVK